MKSLLKYITLFSIALILTLFLAARVKMGNFFNVLFKPALVISKATTNGKLDSTDGRTNVLILGVDRRNGKSASVTSELTDSIMVMSIDENGQKPVMISIPRDFWIQECQMKINAIYVSKLCGNIEGLKRTVQSVLGIPIHYYIVVDFDIFTQAIDLVGGVRVYVDQSFEDFSYPVEGKEDSPNENERYMKVSFKQGWQNLNGQSALQFARSRYSTNPYEQGDFARARRQQKIILALRDKLTSSEVILNPSRIKELYDTYQTNVKTNIGFAESMLFYDIYLKSKGELEEPKRIVFSNETYDEENLGSGMLESPDEEERIEKYREQYVLVTTSRTYDYIHALVRETLFK